jgi:GDP-4-dehydro-6-deoxy-D-mannose reductase
MRETRRLLVTGGSGFVGAALGRLLMDPALSSRWTRVDLPDTLDIRDRESLARAVAGARPDAVLHLAAQSAVPDSIHDPEATLQVNVMGTLHLLQALDAAGFRGRLLYVGTGDVYGYVPETELPVAETRLPQPRNPYAVSKLAAEALCWQWHASQAMDIVLARPFNHIGSGQSPRFAVSDFARQVCEIRAGAAPPVLKVGDIDVTRDFTDVHDVVRAYLALLEHGGAGDIYNVCSGVERSLRSLLVELIRLAKVDARIEAEPARMRGSEQRRMRGDASKIRAATGWSATTPISASLEAAIQFWQGVERNE